MFNIAIYSDKPYLFYQIFSQVMSTFFYNGEVFFSGFYKRLDPVLSLGRTWYERATLREIADGCWSCPEVIKKYMFNSAEHENFPAH